MRKIFLLAGHHLNDSGAVGNGYKENNLTIELRGLVTSAVRRIFPEGQIVNDSDGDTLATVISRVNKVVSTDDILIEFHFDSADRKEASGATALIAQGARERSKSIANELAKITSGVLGITNRGVKSEIESNRGRLGILHTKASSVLLEVAFISNVKDLDHYHCNKLKLADEIAKYIVQIFKS